jgi:hypothetical protein
MRLAVLPAVAVCALLSLASVGSAAASPASASRAAEPWLRNGWLSPLNERLSARIFADQRALGRLGIQLTQWGPDSVTRKTRIYLTHYTRQAAQVLRARYGSDIEVAPFSEPRPGRFARGSDTPPYIGGDFLWIPGTSSLCTGGPIVKDNSTGHLEMLTAGHCVADTGDFVYRSDHSGDTNGPHMGNVVDRDLCNNCLDVAVINANSSGSSYGADIWGADWNTPNEPIFFEDGTSFPDPANCNQGLALGCSGDTVTADSAVTGQVTGITVYAVNQTVTFSDGISTRALSEACSDVIAIHAGDLVCEAAGPVIVHEGDSGGPWITIEGSSGFVHVAGTTVGGNSNGHTAYYEQIGSIDSRYGLSVPSDR